MEFTGEYVTYYQDISKRWNTLIAKCKKLEEKDSSMHDLLDKKMKLFDKAVTEFKGTSFLDQDTMIVCGKKNTYSVGYILKV